MTRRILGALTLSEDDDDELGPYIPNLQILKVDWIVGMFPDKAFARMVESRQGHPEHVIHALSSTVSRLSSIDIRVLEREREDDEDFDPREAEDMDWNEAPVQFNLNMIPKTIKVFRKYEAYGLRVSDDLSSTISILSFSLPTLVPTVELVKLAPADGVALVTGGGQGIGRAISLKLADDGFDIAVNDIPSNQEKLETLVEEIKSKGVKACFVIADVTQEDQVKEMVDTTVKNLGGLDVMVANAGIVQFGIPLTEVTAEDFERIFAVNVKGVFFCYKHAGLQMVAQGRGGRIIGASSVAGQKAGILLGPYSASKFAVRGLTQALAQELGPHHITVNSYAPGAIDTDMREP
ncbi:hypothetical protein HWV62_30877 [Athelia sp. TMB]|nr:hypothetical protein HWV62_30877 [Athelia sp. TMB]